MNRKWVHTSLRDSSDDDGMVHITDAEAIIDDLAGDYENEYSEMERTLNNNISDLEDEIKDLNDKLVDKDSEISSLEYELRRCR